VRVRVIVCVVLLAASVGAAGCSCTPGTGGEGPSPAAVTSTPDATVAVEPTKAPDVGPPAVAPADSIPTSAAILAAARRLAPLNGSAPVTGARIADTTQDSQGRWWAAVTIENEVDGGVIVLYRDADTWKCFVFGTGLDEADLPKDVQLSYE
jgi:hypothetical protein